MKNSNPDGGLLLISLIVTILIAVVGGLIVSADSTNPIETLMFFVRDGVTSSLETEEILEGEDTEPVFIPPAITLPAETTAEDITVSLLLKCDSEILPPTIFALLSVSVLLSLL